MSIINKAHLQKTIEFEYHLQTLEIEPNIFVYELEICYPPNIANLFYQRSLPQKTQLSGVASKSQIEEFSLTKELSTLPHWEYCFISNSEKEFLEKPFRDRFPYTVVSGDDYSQSARKPRQLKIADFLSGNQLNKPVVESLRVGTPYRSPYLYNSRLEFATTSFIFGQDHLINQEDYNLGKLVSYLRTFSNIKIVSECREPAQSRLLGLSSPPYCEFIYYLEPLEAKLLKSVEKLVLAEGALAYDIDSSELFLRMDVMKFREHPEIFSSSESYDLFIDRVNSIVQIVEKASLEQSLETTSHMTQVLAGKYRL